MILVNQICLKLHESSDVAVHKALRLLRLSQNAVECAGVSKISVDARHRPPLLVYTVAVSLKDKGAELSYDGFAPCVSLAMPKPFVLTQGKTPLQTRPVVCGLGPAGLFCALTLARQGYRPIVLERGPEMDERAKAVQTLEQTGVLDENANIQFGEGGAGTFSDGKLTTRIKDPLCAYVMETLLAHGAPQEIALRQKPHIGTDELRHVITSIRKEIERLGGEVHFRTTLTGIKTQQGRVVGVQTTKGDFACEVLVLALGHSARDTFLMLHQTGIPLTPKAFSVGFRAEHLQTRIEESLYHEAAGHPALPRGEYQLSQHVGKRCVYTFCMCPGGHVVAATSEAGGVVTNGMSYHARDGKNANAAVVVSVSEDDFDGDPFKAIEFQRSLEQKAFIAGGGGYVAPAQTMQGFLQGKSHLQITQVEPTYSRGVTAANLGDLFPQELTTTLQTGLRAFERKLHGYTTDSAILTGVETRTSSPVRLLRNELGESVSMQGIYPCGEGAGYAGGIMSAATDGLRIAKSIVEQTQPLE